MERTKKVVDAIIESE